MNPVKLESPRAFLTLLTLAALGSTSACDIDHAYDPDGESDGETDVGDEPGIDDGPASLGLDVDEDFVPIPERDFEVLDELTELTEITEHHAMASCTEFVDVYGQLRDVAPHAGGTWGIGWASPFPGAQGYKIYDRPGGSWQLRPGAAVRVGAHESGIAWVVNESGKLYKWSTAANDWTLQTGLGRDIAVGDDEDDVWVIGYNKKDPTDEGYGVYFLDGTSWKLTNGRGTRIAVEPDRDSVWIVDETHALYRATPNGNQTNLSWEYQPDVTAVDVAVEEDGTVWIVGGPHDPDGHRVYFDDGGGWTFVNQPGLRGTSIGVSPDGVVWVLGESGAIWVSDGPFQC
ncbi:tectonin domain-containing protein [Paraliomyxa miuraensis]|uniref:tectonin domain-containing protein n=1 Tax=Paraliomyxa miuraensis TaxID=376150 RepID=UPI002251B00D|nr:tectonin domain-containing protein [Paraliomyxa miuraensis]MCX4247087.1 hypothetical protein [Paraliomyxa miuraensis]